MFKKTLFSDSDDVDFKEVHGHNHSHSHDDDVVQDLIGKEPEHGPNEFDSASFTNKEIVKVDLQPVSIDGISH